MDAKAINFDLSHLRNEEEFQFAGEVKGLAEDEGLPEVKGLAAPFAAYSELYYLLNTGIEQVRKSEHTAKLKQADKLRGDVYRGFVLFIDAFRHHPNPGKKEAARTIQIVIDSYGNLRDKPYQEETASIYNFLETMDQRCSPAIELLGAASWMEDLSVANDAFDELMTMRFDENVGERVNVGETRRALELAYANFISLVEALVQLDSENPAYRKFIERLNARIVYYRDVLAQRKGRTQKKNGAAEDVFVE